MKSIIKRWLGVSAIESKLIEMDKDALSCMEADLEIKDQLHEIRLAVIDLLEKKYSGYSHPDEVSKANAVSQLVS